MSEEENRTSKVNDIDNTQTKKTIRLRPVLSKAAPVPLVKPTEVAPAAPQSAIPVTPAASDDTRTRKTVKLKPLMPKIASTNKTVDPLEINASGKSIMDGSDTKTRRAIQLSQAQATVKPATIDISNAKAPASGTTDDDRTVKVKRPTLAKPEDGAARPALKFNRPAAPVSVAAPKPAPAVVPPRPAAIPVSPQLEEDDEIIDYDDDETPDKLQFTLSVVAAIALLISGTLLALSYFNVAL